jgi:hypothetical protein
VFLTQEWSNPARDDVPRLRSTLPRCYLFIWLVVLRLITSHLKMEAACLSETLASTIIPHVDLTQKNIMRLGTAVKILSLTRIVLLPFFKLSLMFCYMYLTCCKRPAIWKHCTWINGLILNILLLFESLSLKSIYNLFSNPLYFDAI